MATNNQLPTCDDLGFDLRFTSITPRGSVPGTWVCGTLHGYRFEALVFPKHADNPDYEIRDSRISKLWLRRQTDNRVMFSWERGPDIPAVDHLTQTIVDFLCEGLADSAYPA